MHHAMRFCHDGTDDDSPMTTGKDDPRPPGPQRAPGQNVPAGQSVRRLLVSDLLAGDREVILEHGGQDYRLRITANGKLILTK